MDLNSENQYIRHVSKMTRETLALILAGGRGSRLKQLTSWRAKPAVPFGGKFRIIDFPLSNCINSGIKRLGIITQYKSHSLIQHIQKGWGFLGGRFGDFVELLPAQQRLESSWYLGTADAVYQNIDIIRSHRPKYVLILAGDHIYKMDYGPMIAAHVNNKADLTVGCIEVNLEEAQAYGVISVDDNQRITKFTEKPTHPDTLPGQTDVALASMGIYVFNTAFLFEQLIKDADTSHSKRDFGRDIIPAVIKQYRVMSYPFHDTENNRQGYWRDVGTIDSYWKANMELISITPELNLYDENWPIWTYQEQLPPAKFIFDDNDGRRGVAIDSMISGGCIISGASVKQSLLFSNITVHAYSEINNTVILPNVVIGEHCKISNAIIEKGCIIPDNMIIGADLEQDSQMFYVSPNGIVLVTPKSLNQEVQYAR